MSKKHLSLEDRFKIEKGLLNRDSFTTIGNAIHKNKSTISREIKNHYYSKKYW